MNRPFPPCLIAAVVIVSGCQWPASRPDSAPKTEQLSANGATFTYQEQGRGAPVIFVHGAWSDHRIWEAQRVVVSERFTYIAYDQRYFGVGPWPENGPVYSQSTHAADLAAFIRGLNLGPVHVVARSYGAQVALAMVVEHPDLVGSMFLHEPALSSQLTDADDLKAANEDRKSIVPVREMAMSGDAAEATRMFYEWVNNAPGTFGAQSEEMQSMEMDNARTVPMHFNAPSPQTPVTCVRLSEIKVPVVITMGELTRPFFKATSSAAQKCIPGAKLVTLPGGRHGTPNEQASAFNAVLLDFLEHQ